MNAYKVEVQLNEDGQLALSGLPFMAGAIVEVILLEQSPIVGSPMVKAVSVADSIGVPNGPLQGMKPYRYDDPFESADR
jgi:hypothetical protein